MSREAHLPDGTILEFPDDAADDVIDRAVQAHIANPENDSRSKGFMGGLVKPVDNAAEALSNVPYVGPAVDKLGQSLGMPSTADAVANNQAARSNNSRTGYQFLGNLAGTLPLAALGGGPALQGALSGLALTDAKDPYNILADTAVSAVASKGVSSALNKAGALIAPQFSKGMRALHDAGVPLTLGQIASDGKGLLSRFIQGTEENLAKLPYVGDAINVARDRGTSAYYKALLKRTGVDVPENIPFGHDAHEFIGGQLSGRYQKLLPNLRVEADDKMREGLSAVGRTIKTTTPQRYKQFVGILKQAGLSDTGGVNIDGKKLQHADQVLRTYGEKFGKSIDPNDKIMGDAFNQIRQQFRSLNMRQNPKYAPQLQELNKGWRELALIRKAAGDINKGDGLFSPAKYAGAARGSRSNAQLTRAADQFLPNRSPDSGTTRGLATSYLLMGGIPSVAGATLSPAAAIPALAAPLYTPAGQKAMNKFLFAPRGKTAEAVGKGFTYGGKFIPLAIPPLLQAQNK